MWPELREAQRRALALRNTAMAVTIDIGNPEDIHPGNKREVGRRLDLALQGVSGPVLRQVTHESGGLRLWFDNADALRLTGDGSFEVAGADRKFTPVRARVDGSTVVLDRSGSAVRYSWSDNPQATLYNAAGLPASPFLRHSK
jgi:sialate O-acetylesterase